MKTFDILYFDLTSITKDDIIWGLLECKQNVKRSELRVPDGVYTEETLTRALAAIRDEELIISQDFSAVLAEACHQKGRLYLAWVYDAPQAALYMKEAKYETNLIFLFDRKQIERLKAFGIPNLFHEPLAANLTRMATLVLTEEEIASYQTDVLFVGSLYQEEKRSNYLKSLPDDLRRFSEDLFSKDLGLWGWPKHIFDPFPAGNADRMKEKLKQAHLEDFGFSAEYLLQTLILARELAERERFLLLETLSESYRVDLYTGGTDPEGRLKNVNWHAPIDPATEVFKAYYSARINLNHFLPSIETGVSQRVFDVLSVGGFLMTCDQEELHELFEPNRELVVFSDINELKVKADYYLRHEDERLRIGVNGYQRVKADYNYPAALNRMLTIVEQNFS